MEKFSVILAAAGKSSRFGDPTIRKPFAQLDGQPIWLYAARRFSERSDVEQIIIVLSPDDHDDFLTNSHEEIESMQIDIAIGGKERADSIENALAIVNPDCGFVVIHDAARPCITRHLVDTVFAAASQDSAAIPAIPVHSTLKRSLGGRHIDETVDRSDLYLAQTPQVFSRELIQSLYANRGTTQPTDEAQLAETQGHSVRIVPGSPLNIKITTQPDLDLAEACLTVLKAKDQ